MAKLEFSGLFQLDVFYEDISDEQAAGGVVQGTVNRDNGSERTWIDLAGTGNRLYWRYTSDDKKIISYWQYRPVISALELAWVQWELSPMFRLRFGQSEQTFAILAPSQTVGRDGAAPIVGIGWCNIHGGSARQQVKAYIYPAENVRIEFAAIDPDNDGGEAVAAFPASGANGETVREENTIPRLDLAVNFKVANFTIEPSVTWLSQDYDQVAAGSDDEVDIWGAALGVSAGFGPVTIKAEIATGENLGDGNYVGANFSATEPEPGNAIDGVAVGYDSNGDGVNDRIEDTEVLGYWIDVGFKFGPATLHVMYGALDMENDGDPSVAGDAGEFERKTQFYGVNLPISVAKGWTIKPEIMYYDWDDDATVGGNKFDYGDQTMVGVGFILKF
jgi:hypothetical protein